MRSTKARGVPLDDQKALSFSAAITIGTSSRLHADRPRISLPSRSMCYNDLDYSVLA
jgi:hypothetical protein